MTPTIGRTVHYTLNAADVAAINAAGGNTHRPGDVVPLIIVKVWPGAEQMVNGQLIVDTPTGTHWALSKPHAGDEPREGTWSWPPRV